MYYPAVHLQCHWQQYQVSQKGRLGVSRIKGKLSREHYNYFAFKFGEFCEAEGRGRQNYKKCPRILKVIDGERNQRLQNFSFVIELKGRTGGGQDGKAGVLAEQNTCRIRP